MPTLVDIILACGFCVSRKDGTGGGGWLHPQGDILHGGHCGWAVEMQLLCSGWCNQFSPWLHKGGLEDAISPCRGFISHSEGDLGSE